MRHQQYNLRIEVEEKRTVIRMSKLGMLDILSALSNLNRMSTEISEKEWRERDEPFVVRFLSKPLGNIEWILDPKFEREILEQQRAEIEERVRKTWGAANETKVLSMRSKDRGG